MDNMLQAKLDLRIELEIGKRMDDSIIPNKINKIFNDIFVKDDSKSPFRNVLAAATEPGTSIEVIKNYIRYQVGRSGSSEIWKTKKEKNGKIFAQEVVEHIQELQDDAENITKDLEKSIYQTISLDSRLNKEEKIKN
ncbi:hypothetical protein [Okeania sp. KiyG1]|uniref:hypothetical protein n=1 Tax=Okeania sp. KiyG1 TaxID=2720165 RepID=UPI0019246561|nr:hypothetical protein [Okeania sp. KiyG1]GGA44796.1 hypothetical protein CYANOKiyG1_63620 [Okeania sp. KiyG1]